MFLILADESDASAAWLADALAGRGVELMWVTPRQLLAARWRGRLGIDDTSFELELTDGRTVETRHVRGVLNRVAQLPPDVLDAARGEDREYAAQELFALCLAFLDHLPGPAWNRPTPRWLAGPFLHELEWSHLAARAGFRIARRTWEPVVGGDERAVIVVDDVVLPDMLPPALAAACRALARYANTALLEIRLGEHDGFRCASPLPDLRRGGGAFVEHVLARLR